MTIELLFGLIGGLGGIIAIIFTIKNWEHNSNKEMQSTGETTGQILTKLGFIENKIDRIDVKVDKLEDGYVKTVQNLSELNTYKDVIEQRFINHEHALGEIEKRLTNLEHES